MTMSPGRQISLFLLLRIVVSLGVISLATASIVTAAIIITGLTAILTLGTMLFIIETIFLSSENPIIGISQFTLLEISFFIIVAGAILFPLVYYQPVKREIQEFNEKLGATGQLASERHTKISRTATRIAQQADIPAPEVRIVNRSRPESYTLGGLSTGTIIITRGVIRQLTETEIEAVLAHEVSHLANGDGRLMNYLLIPLLIAEDLSSNDRPKFRLKNGFGVFIFIAKLGSWVMITLITTILLFVCQLGVSLLSRAREFTADQAAAKLTGSPGALASALEKLAGARTRPTEDLRNIKRSAGPLDILPLTDQAEQHWLLRTHPTTEARIDRLRQLSVD
ncbi:M48 family metallopeptidase [Natronocalculus amylovorans]|uniref:M48 family metalloprotease n=1 Tax=Natronocalculus amylovorans TaxID=2917812 RepID=A0AAE3KA14_9EURY|nr:M48 family metalloprotease [Natronocalculus amylovorans]MCL9818548.1 M48 family metalloprotease [Natronocalculus amylovorans]